jgi:hypothetical protein
LCLVALSDADPRAAHGDSDGQSGSVAHPDRHADDAEADSNTASAHEHRLRHRDAPPPDPDPDSYAAQAYVNPNSSRAVSHAVTGAHHFGCHDPRLSR